MKGGALPGILLIVAGALVTYWSLTKLGLFVPKGSGTATDPAATQPGVKPPGQTEI